jgi:hypothetical protein
LIAAAGKNAAKLPISASVAAAVVSLYSRPPIIAASFFAVASPMSIAQIKNLQRRMANMEQEAIEEVTRACGHELWQSLGFDALDSVEDPDRRARANYYYGQLLTVRELKEAIG